MNLPGGLTITLCLASPFLIGVALPGDEPEDPGLRVEQTIAALERMPDPDSWAAGALLSSGKHRDLSLALMERASAAYPMRADLLRLQIEICMKAGSCDPNPIEARLREADPSNAAGWSGFDETATDAALAAIGHKERFDTYYTSLVSKLSAAVIRVNKMSAPEAVVTIIGYLAAQPAPYIAASKICKGERLEQPAIKEACRGIAHAYQQGDTYLTEMIGVGIAKRVWPEDSPEWKAAAEARRVYDYRSKLWLALSGPDAAFMEQFLKLCANNRREQDVWAAQIAEAGEDPNPPAIGP